MRGVPEVSQASGSNGPSRCAHVWLVLSPHLPPAHGKRLPRQVEQENGPFA